VSWNTKDLLIECLRSITEDQGTGAIEIIVVDNGSVDGSADAVQERFPQVTLIRNSANLGFARANNLGIARAAGDYVCLVNPDIVVRPGAIATLIRFMDARPRVGLAGPRVLNADGTLQHSCRRFPGLVACTSNTFGINKLFPTTPALSGEMMKYWDHSSERSVDAVSGCFSVIRRTALREVGDLDEDFFMYAEDVDCCMRLHAAGWDVRFCPDATVVHFGGASTSSDRRRFAGEMLVATAKLYRKHYSRPTAAYLRVLAVVYHLVRLFARLLAYPLRPERRQFIKAKIDEHLAVVEWMRHGLR
jgi:GT2 family glycosyltransferase